MTYNRDKTNFRVQGSAFTFLQWNNRILGYLQGVAETSPRPVAAPVAIQPMDAPYPLDIITPAAVTAGTLTGRFYERFGTKIWDELMDALPGIPAQAGQNRYNDLVSVFVALAAMPTPVTSVRIIHPPVTAGAEVKPYGDIYMNCKITDIRDDEDVSIGSMESVKTIVITYTRKIRTDIGGGNVLGVQLGGTGATVGTTGVNLPIPLG